MIDERTSLEHMQELGVRGVRVNLQTGGERDPAVATRLIDEAVRRAAPLGWHVQLWTNAAMVAALHERLSTITVPVVIDHFGLASSMEEARPLLSLLARGNTWIKLSAPHRVGSGVDAVARALVVERPDRLVWGSDWPHPGMGARTPEAIQPFDAIDDAAALERRRRWCGDGRTLERILVDNPARLYAFAG